MRLIYQPKSLEITHYQQFTKKDKINTVNTRLQFICE